MLFLINLLIDLIHERIIDWADRLQVYFWLAQRIDDLSAPTLIDRWRADLALRATTVAAHFLSHAPTWDPASCDTPLENRWLRLHSTVERACIATAVVDPMHFATLLRFLHVFWVVVARGTRTAHWSQHTLSVANVGAHLADSAEVARHATDLRPASWRQPLKVLHITAHTKLFTSLNLLLHLKLLSNG